MTLADSCHYTQPVVPGRHKRRGARLLLPCFLACLVLTLVVVLPRSSVSVHGEASELLIRLDPTNPSTDTFATTYPNCRFGIGQLYHPLISYSISSLNLGWYLNWGLQVNPSPPGGVEYAQLVHVKSDGYSPSDTVLASAIAANPGALWLIGNEPDRVVYQDDVLPQDYARAYHDAYAFIKAHDPTARVAAGGIVQPTPLRMQYLDIVLDTYIAVYGMSLPTDAWSIHSFILREASCAAYPPDFCWGAEVPQGISATLGILYTLDDTDNLDIFRQRIIQFRQWMKDRGYRNVPLLITEYGTLLPYYDPANPYYDSKGHPFDEARARDFMYGTFDFMRTAADQNLGYSADENRLVQRWLWYSLDDTSYGGALFNPYSFARMQLGADYAAYTGAITPTVDLLAVDVMQIGPVPFSPTEAATITLRAHASNVGNISVTEPITVRFLDGSGTQIGADQIITRSLAGCAGVQGVTVTWSNVPPGAHSIRVVVDPENLIRENDEGNNQVTGAALVARHQVFLPLVSKR